ncbi:DMT family transporter [Aquipuribacter sp. SD81]|uniref:DMT family transporter n=1 Tax=Aquipuribacter sp. SD81 TaxID=3127703 RepID=UPI003019E168
MARTEAAAPGPRPGPVDDSALTPRERLRHRAVVVVSLVSTVLVGIGVASQSRVNGELSPRMVPPAVAAPGWAGLASERVAAGLDTAILSFGIGLAVVTTGALLTPRGRRGLRAVGSSLRHGRLRWWQLLGGAGGATLVTSQGVAVPALGVAVFTVTIVAGVTVAGLVVDRVGLSPNGVRPWTPRRVLGALLAVGGVTLSVSGGLGEGGGAPVLALVGALLLAFVAGSLTAAQQAVNGHVAVHAGSPWVAGVVNFTVGLTTLVLARLVLVGTARPALPPPAEQWWLYLSGPIGVSFIVLAALLVRTLGVLVLGLGNTAGQLVGSIALDELFPTAAGRPGAVELVAAVVIFAAVALAASRPRRRAP